MTDGEERDSIAEFNARHGIRPLPATTGLGLPANPRAWTMDEAGVPFGRIPDPGGLGEVIPFTGGLPLGGTVAQVSPPQFGCVDACVPFINVEAFGADRTGNKWSTGAFVAARLAALYYRKIVFVPSGDYKIAPGLEVGGVDWLGANVGGWSYAIGGTLSTPTGPVSVGVNKEFPRLIAGKKSNGPLAIVSDPTNMRGLGFDANGMTPIALDIKESVHSSTFEKVGVLNAAEFGLRIDGNEGASFRHCGAKSCGTGFLFHLCKHVNCYDLSASLCDGPGLEIVGDPKSSAQAGIVNVWGFILNGNGLLGPTPLKFMKYGKNPAILLRGVGGGVLEGFYMELTKPSDGVVLAQNCHNVTLRQFRITGGSSSGHRAVRLVDCRGCTLQQFMLSADSEARKISVETFAPTGGSPLFNTVDALIDTHAGIERLNSVLDFIGVGAENIWVPAYMSPLKP